MYESIAKTKIVAAESIAKVSHHTLSQGFNNVQFQSPRARPPILVVAVVPVQCFAT